MKTLSGERFLGTFMIWCLWATGMGVGAEQTGSADWWRFRGPTGQGRGEGVGLPLSWGPNENVVWKTSLPGPGGSSPVVFGDHIFLTCFSGYAVPGAGGGDLESLERHVLCIDRADGRILWKKDIPAAQPEQVRVRDHGYASSTPLVDADRVYVFLGRSGVRAFRHDGEPVWQAEVGNGTHEWGSAASPVLHGNLVIVNAAVESESLVALDRATGKEVWRMGGMRESWNTPILVPVGEGKQELVVAIHGQVLGVEPDTGELLWSCATGIRWYMVPSLVSEGDVVYCVGGRTGGSLAVRAGGRGDVTGTHRRWTLHKGTNVPSPILHEGHLYWLHENLGIVYCVAAATGELIYEQRLADAGQFYGSPILVEGRLYAFTRDGVGFVLAARPRFEQLARNDLEDRGSFDASPAVDGNRLLVRSDRFVYCLGVE